MTRRAALSLIVIAAVISTGCSNLSPGENAAVFGAAGGAAAGGIARAAGMSTAESIATGVAAGAIIGATTYIITKHQASERQRRIAEERARVAYRQLPPQKKTGPKKVRYIAVDTAKDDRTSPKAKKSVMLWDTESQQVVGNDVYDVQSPPPIGSTAKFETYSAEYVGSGT